MNSENTWSVPIDLLMKRTTEKIEDVARQVTVLLFSRVISKSPVGNPDIWKANSHRNFARKNFNTLAGLRNSRIANGEGGTTIKRRSGKALRKDFPNVVGKGYVGGRFRTNWNVSYGTPDTSTSTEVRPARGDEQALLPLSMAVGGTVYLSNGLPYAYRLEHGWSTQAPIGMVKVSVAEFDQHIRKAIAK